MKILLFAVLVGLLGVESSVIHAPGRARRASASEASVNQAAAIVRSETHVHPNGFSYEYETNNGISEQASGTLKDEAIAVQGQYKYVSPEGVPLEVTYTADAEGFKPVGDHLPVAPPIPDAIQRSLKYIAEHPPPVESTYKRQ